MTTSLHPQASTTSTTTSTPTATVTSLAARRAAPPVHAAVSQAIEIMTSRYFERITLDDVSSEVYVSPFHLSRLFAKATGVTPGRYLTAVRLFEAKRLLVTSSMTVSDIICTVGYSSVGTFTSRFTRAVGMTPSQYRDPDVYELLLAVAPHFQRLPSLAALREAGENCSAPRPVAGTSTVTVHVEVPAGTSPGNLLVGAFAEGVPQCRPVAFAGLADTGSATLTLEGVPEGRWSLLAAAEHRTGDPSAPTTLSFGTLRSPVTVGAGDAVQTRVRMRPLRPTDPPIAITLAGTDGTAGAQRLHRATPLRALPAAA